MNFRAWKALARGVVLDAIRRKDIWVVAIIGLLIILCAGSLGFFGFAGLQIFAKDLGLSVLGLLSTIVAVATASRVLPEEIKNRTLYPLLARPISRFDLLFGKWIGSVLVSWCAFVLLAAAVALAFVIFGIGFESILLQYMLCKMMGLALVCAFALFMSTVLTPSAAFTMALIITFAAPMLVRALTMAGLQNPSMAWLFQVVNALVPQFNLFDISARAVYIGWSPVPIWVLLSLLVYMAVYGGSLLTFSWLRFRSRPI